MATVVTYEPNAYCQLKLDSGERILISCGHDGIRIVKMRLGGRLPTKTIARWSIKEIGAAVDAFADPSDPTLSPLDAIKKKLMSCASISEVERLCKHQEKVPSPSENDEIKQAQELVNKYGAVLEQTKSVIASEALLPASKEQIKAAILQLARYAKASGATDKALAPLKVGYASLADFVTVESAKVSNDFDRLLGAGLRAGSSADLLETARGIAGLGESASSVRRESVEEHMRLAGEFDANVIASAHPKQPG
jgi:hypothetical protein